jgi:hypothetical protein
MLRRHPPSRAVIDADEARLGIPLEVYGYKGKLPPTSFHEGSVLDLMEDEAINNSIFDPPRFVGTDP